MFIFFKIRRWKKSLSKRHHVRIGQGGGDKKKEEGAAHVTTGYKLCNFIASNHPFVVASLSHSSLLSFYNTRLSLQFSIHVTFYHIVLFSANISIFLSNSRSTILLIMFCKFPNVLQWRTENSTTNECMCSCGGGFMVVAVDHLWWWLKLRRRIWKLRIIWFILTNNYIFLIVYFNRLNITYDFTKSQ